MNNNLKKVLVVGGIVVATYLVGTFVLSNVVTAVVIAGVSGAAYIGYKKFKQSRNKNSAFHSPQELNIFKKTPTYTPQRAPLSEKDAEFMFMSDSNKKEF